MDKKSVKQPTIKNEFNIYKLLTFLLAAILLVVIGILGRNWLVARDAQRQYEDLAEQVNRLQNQSNQDNYFQEKPVETQEITEGTEEGTQESEDVITEDAPEFDVPQKNLDWAAIREINPDIYAWICIPGTEVDYPILQHPTDDSYYLNYNMNGTRGYPGCIYTERLNRKDFTDFDTVVYGHNMRNDSMFATLHNFEDKTFFDSNPYVYIYIGDKVLVYEIFAAYTGGNEHILYANDFTNEAGRKSYLDSIAKSNYMNANLRDTELTTESHILTLSTCVQGHAKNRYLVQAVLRNEEALTE